MATSACIKPANVIKNQIRTHVLRLGIGFGIEPFMISTFDGTVY